MNIGRCTKIVDETTCTTIRGGSLMSHLSKVADVEENNCMKFLRESEWMRSEGK